MSASRKAGSDPATMGCALGTPIGALCCRDGRPVLACCGDSITQGHGIPDRNDFYPTKLQALLGSYRVLNFGLSGSCATLGGALPYWTSSTYASAIASKPSIVVLMLGTNDCAPENWEIGTFAENLRQGVEHLRALPTNVLLCRPPPLLMPSYKGTFTAMLAAVDLVAAKATADGLVAGIVDVHGVLAGKPELTPDDVHPNAAGATLIAEAVHGALMRV